jgi:hypothetical protein
MAVLRQELNELASQLTPGASSAREQVIQDQIESTTERLESLQEQLDRALTGAPLVSMTEVPAVPEDRAIPRDVMALIEMSFVTLVVLALGMPLVRMIARRFEGRSAPAESGGPRMDRLEQAVDAVAIEVERISEGQRYTNRMIAEMRGLPAPSPMEAWPAARAPEPEPVRRDPR